MNDILTLWLKAGIMEQEEVAIAWQWHCKQFSMTTNKCATTEELLEAVFSMWSMLRLCNITDLLSALLSNGSVNKPQQRDRFYVVRDATVAMQHRSIQTHLCGNWSTHNNEKFSVQSAQRLYNATLVGRQTVLSKIE
jgi:hypothetical protein